MTESAPQAVHLRIHVDGQDHDYAFEDLPKNAQLLLQDMMRMDKEINDLHYRLRQLQAAKQVYAQSLQRALQEQEVRLEESAPGLAGA